MKCKIVKMLSMVIHNLPTLIWIVRFVSFAPEPIPSMQVMYLPWSVNVTFITLAVELKFLPCPSTCNSMTEKRSSLSGVGPPTILFGTLYVTKAPWGSFQRKNPSVVSVKHENLPLEYGHSVETLTVTRNKQSKHLCVICTGVYA